MSKAFDERPRCFTALDIGARPSKIQNGVSRHDQLRTTKQGSPMTLDEPHKLGSAQDRPATRLTSPENRVAADDRLTRGGLRHNRTGVLSVLARRPPTRGDRRTHAALAAASPTATTTRSSLPARTSTPVLPVAPATSAKSLVEPSATAPEPSTDQLTVWSQTAAAAEVQLTELAQSRYDIDAQLLQQRDGEPAGVV